MGNGSEPGLAPHGAEIVSEFGGIKLSTVIENDGLRNDVLPNEPSYLCCGYGGDDFGLYSLSEVVDRHKKYLHCPVALGKGLRMSMPQIANDRRLIIGVMGVEGTRWIGTNLWHLSQVHTIVMASSRKLGQL